MMTLRSIALAAIAVGSCTLIAGCGNDRKLAHQTLQIQEQETYIAQLEADLEQAKRERTATVIQTQPATANDVDDFRNAVGPTDGVSFYGSGSNLIVRLEDRILFRPASEVLSGSARATLASVATVIKRKYPSNKIEVVGHSDSDPIRKSKDKWDDNHELAGARAHEVFKYLKRDGVSNQMAIVAQADNVPTGQGKAKDRRVEIVIINATSGKKK